MELLIGTILSALAVAFALGIVELITPANFYRYVKIAATYPFSLIALWYLDFDGFPIFVCAAASAWLALIATIVVEKLSVTVVTKNYRR
jgi:hypothetical protein